MSRRMNQRGPSCGRNGVRRARCSRAPDLDLLVSVIWYGFWLVGAALCGKVVSDPSEIGLLHEALPGALILMVLYWQVVPVLMSATGASLDLQRLKVYPIRLRALFGIEVLLRATSAVEMILLLIGTAIGSMLNPMLPLGAALAILPFIVFNLFLAVGIARCAGSPASP